MRHLIVSLMLVGGVADAQAPVFVFAPLCHNGQVVGVQIGALRAVSAGEVAVVRWGAKVCAAGDS